MDESRIELRTVKIDNAKEVEEVDIDFRFTPPYNLELWNPSNGEVLIIQ